MDLGSTWWIAESNPKILQRVKAASVKQLLNLVFLDRFQDTFTQSDTQTI